MWYCLIIFFDPPHVLSCLPTSTFPLRFKQYRRYFILVGSNLFFASAENTAPHGMIDLSKCQTVKSAEIKANKKFAFEVSTQETTFYMYADSEKDKDEWIGAIGRSIVQSSRTYQKDTENSSGEESDSD